MKSAQKRGFNYKNIPGEDPRTPRRTPPSGGHGRQPDRSTSFYLPTSLPFVNSSPSCLEDDMRWPDSSVEMTLAREYLCG